jgi:uncharacterized Tic20 family protein
MSFSPEPQELSERQEMVEIPPETRSLIPTTPEDRQWALFAHLSGLLATSLGGLGFLGPLIIWLIKKDQSKFVDDQGKEALNFQLNLLGYVLLSIPVGLLIALVTLGFGIFLLIPLYAALGVYGIIMPILAAVDANKGNLYRYPATIRIIK